jgi:hypothetical protein
MIPILQMRKLDPGQAVDGPESELRSSCSQGSLLPLPSWGCHSHKKNMAPALWGFQEMVGAGVGRHKGLQEATTGVALCTTGIREE